MPKLNTEAEKTRRNCEDFHSGWLNPFTETHRKQMTKKNAATERKAAAKSTEKQIKAPAKTALKNGLLKTGQLRAEKEQLKKKSTKRVPSSDSESQTEPKPPYSNSTNGEGDSMSNSDETISEQPPQQKEIRSKRRFDHVVVGSNAPLNPTQESSAFAV
ncbi:hypothetical protein PIB30_046732 [Stylosanthes scabra]|uniref:Uncharacterized protein n=1 Tax=Stylosanthes scabra TaxID=79078 RepID=A0ABU6QH34_9FABA|nr:hypothetical protein [Stylosanthes scabra]